MVKISAREAVKRFDVSRPTLTKALNSGKLSGVKDGNDQWEIDTAELVRVYAPRSSDAAKNDDAFTSDLTTFTPYDNQTDQAEIERLKAALTLAETRADAAERLAQERAERIEDLRRMLPPPQEPARRRRWPWSR